MCGECGPCRAERISYCERARALKSSGRRTDGSIPMSRNGEPVYSCFFQQSSFASFAVAPAKDVVKIRRDAPIEVLGPLGCGSQTGAGAVLTLLPSRWKVVRTDDYTDVLGDIRDDRRGLRRVQDVGRRRDQNPRVRARRHPDRWTPA